MSISQLNSINYNARKQNLRELEKVLRIMSSEFSFVSGTKMAEFDNANMFMDTIDKINTKITKKIKERVIKQKDNTKRALKLIRLVKAIRLANCGDYAELCAIICKLNGIDVIRPLLTSFSEQDKKDEFDTGIKIVDHEILMVRPKKNFGTEEMGHLKEIIVDPWLGFVGYANNVKQKFMGDYSKFFKFHDDTRLFLDCKNHTIISKTDELCDLIKKKYPQFIIKKTPEKK